MSIKDQDSRKLLVGEAISGGFYVAVTRGLFVLMLASAGYSLKEIAYVILYANTAGLLLSSALYYRESFILKHAKNMLIICHTLERVLWLALPFMIVSKILTITFFTAANLLAILATIMINVFILEVSHERSIADLVGKRTAGFSVTSFIGNLASIVILYAVNGFKAYMYTYVAACIVGLLGSLLMFLMPYNGRMTSNLRVGVKEDIEVSRVNTFIFMLFMFTGGSLVSMSWPIFLKSKGYSDWLIALIVNLMSNIGATLGSLKVRNIRTLELMTLTNAFATYLIPFASKVQYQALLSITLSSTFAGFNILTNVVYAGLKKYYGSIKGSIMLTSSFVTAQIIASIIAHIAPDVNRIFLIAGLWKLTGAIFGITLIPKISLLPSRKALSYGRIPCDIGLLMYNMMYRSVKEAYMTFNKIWKLTLLILASALIYFIMHIILATL